MSVHLYPVPRDFLTKLSGALGGTLSSTIGSILNNLREEADSDSLSRVRDRIRDQSQEAMHKGEMVPCKVRLSPDQMRLVVDLQAQTEISESRVIRSSVDYFMRACGEQA